MKTLILSLLFSMTVLAVNAQMVIDGDGDIRVGTNTNAISKMEFGANQWLKFNTNNGTSKSGLLFFESGPTNLSNDLQYGARLYYDELNDRLHISTKQNNVENYCITLQRTYGRVGILNVSPSYQLDVNGNVRVTSITINSDLRLKSDIKGLDTTAIEKIKNLAAIQFKPVYKYPLPGSDNNKVSDTTDIYLVKENERLNKTRFGFSAQEVQKYFPGLVSEDNEGYLSVDYIGLIPVLVEALKAQDKKIADLEKRLISIEKKGK